MTEVAKLGDFWKKVSQFQPQIQQLQLIALDLDHTTLNQTTRLSFNTKQVLEQAADAGLELVITTGRSRHSLPPELAELAGLHYAVLSNGSSIYDFTHEEYLRRLTIPVSFVEPLLQCFHGSLDLQVFVHGQAYASEHYLTHTSDYFSADSGRLAHLARSRIVVSDVRQFASDHQNELDMLDFLIPKWLDRDTILQQLKQQFPHLYITTSMPHLIEVAHPDCGKWPALQWLAHQLQIPATHIAAFGDAENDLDMISHSGLGCAVANAVPSVLRAADLIVPAHDRDGVASGIQAFLQLRRSGTN